MRMFKRSFNELKSVQCIAVTGVLVALYIVIKTYTTIDISPPILRFNFAYIALAMIGMLYGPVVALIAAIPCDLIGAIFRGGGILWGLTPVYMFQGLVYGVFLYGFRAQKSFWKNAKLVIAQAIVIFVSQMTLNTLVLYFYGFIGANETSAIPVITMRVTKNLIEFPVSVILVYAVLVSFGEAHRRVFGRTKP